MRVLVNGVASLRPKSGIGHYIDSLHQHLVESMGEERVAFFPGPVARRIAKRLLRTTPRPTEAGTMGPSPQSKRKSPLASPMRLAKHWGSLAFRKLFRVTSRRGFDLYHEPNYIPWACDLPVVATIHDLSVLLYPQWHPAERVDNFEKHFFGGLDRCRHLIADSDYIRREIIEKLHFPAERVTTVHLGVRPGFRPLPATEVLPILEKIGLRPGYLLHVGTIEPRKNLLMLMRAFVDLPAPLREKHPLVLIGGWGWRNEEIRDYFETTARRAGVRHIGYVSEEQLPAIYNGARALVFPSHYEGFGFPPLEMMACGGAVLASTAGSLREILPERSRLYSPDDLVSWREAMRDSIEDDDLLAQLQTGTVKHAGRFTWANCARQTWGVYENVLEPRKRAQAA